MEIIDLARIIRNGEHFHVTTSIVPLVRHGEAKDLFDTPCEGFAANLMVLSDHCSTHMDAPFHFIRKGNTIEKIRIERFIGPALVCDVSDSSGSQIEADHLIAALAKIDQPIRSGGFVLLKTIPRNGQGKGIGRSAAEYLVKQGVSLVGTDHGGIDNTSNRDRPGHMTLLGNNVLIVENLVNLNQIVGKEVLFVATPLAFEGGTGSPVRPIAICPYAEAPWPLLSSFHHDEEDKLT